MHVIRVRAESCSKLCRLLTASLMHAPRVKGSE